MKTVDSAAGFASKSATIFAMTPTVSLGPTTTTVFVRSSEDAVTLISARAGWLPSRRPSRPLELLLESGGRKKLLKREGSVALVLPARDPLRAASPKRSLINFAVLDALA